MPKRKWMLYILAVLAVVLVVFLIVASRQPDEFRVERSTLMAAPPSAIFPEVDDLHKWQAWSPFVEYDPNMVNTYVGPASGVGAEMAWSGNSRAGQGRMTIIEDRPGELVRIKLEFTKPFNATNIAEFTFKPEGERTLVTWAMTGHNNFGFKVMHTVMNMDKMLGKDFDRGLAKLKTVVEAK